MILEVLQEQQKLNEVSVKVTGKKKADIETALGIKGFNKADYEDFAKTKADKSVIDDKDINHALKYAKNTDPYKTRKKIAKKLDALEDSDVDVDDEEDKEPSKPKMDKTELEGYEDNISIIDQSDYKRDKAKVADRGLRTGLRWWDDYDTTGLDDLKKRMEDARAKFLALPDTEPSLNYPNSDGSKGPQIPEVKYNFDELSSFLGEMSSHNYNTNHIFAQILWSFQTKPRNWVQTTAQWLKDNTTATSDDVKKAVLAALDGIDFKKTRPRENKKQAQKMWARDAATVATMNLNAKPTTSFATEPKIGKNFLISDLLAFLNSKDPGLGTSLTKHMKNAGVDVTKLKTMDTLEEAKNILEPEDIQIWYDKAQDPEETSLGLNDAEYLDKALKAFYKEVTTSSLDDVNKELVRDKISKIIQFERESSGTMRTSQGVSSGYNITSRSATEIGKVDFQMVKAFSAAFPGEEDFNARIGLFGQYVNEVQKHLADPSSEISGTTSSKFSKFITLDLMQQILYSFEASSAGWVFESFLAFMAFGDAIGASYGAGDFSIPVSGKSMEGSAKLLQAGDTSQSTKGWPDYEELSSSEKHKATIRYVIGVKTTKSEKGFYDKTTQTDRVGRVALYLIDLKRIGNTVYHNEAGSEIDETNNKGSFPIDKKDRISIDVDSYSPTQVMEFAFLQQAEFEDYSSRIVSDISEDLEKAMSAMSELKANLDDYVMAEAGHEDKTYSSSEALRNYALLGTALGTYTGGTGVFGDAKLKENKLKTIDDLIAETIKGIMKKRKK